MADPCILSLDIGTKRIGVGRASLAARLAQPLNTIENNEHVMETLTKMAASENAVIIVVGLPRGLEGQETDQTSFTREFTARLKAATNIPIFEQDEALSTIRARETLEQSGKPFEKGDIDALAAAYILQDFMDMQSEIVKRYQLA